MPSAQSSKALLASALLAAAGFGCSSPAGTAAGETKPAAAPVPPPAAPDASADAAPPVMSIVTLNQPVAPDGVARLRARFEARGLWAAVGETGTTVVLRGPPTAVAAAEEALRLADGAPIPRLDPAAAPPADSRLVALHRSDPSQISAKLRAVFPEVEILARPRSRSLLLEGRPALVNQAAEAARALDGAGADPADSGETPQLRQDRLIREADARLAAVLPTVRFKEVPLREAVLEVCRRSRAQFIIDWDGMESEGLDLEHPISLELRDIAVADLLYMMLRKAWMGGASENRPEVATRVYTTAYDVRDLLPGGADEETFRTEVDRIENLIKSAHPATFGSDPAADAPGQVRFFQGSMMVQQTAVNHGRVREILAQARKCADEKANRRAGPLQP